MRVQFARPYGPERSIHVICEGKIGKYTFYCQGDCLILLAEGINIEIPPIEQVPVPAKSLWNPNQFYMLEILERLMSQDFELKEQGYNLKLAVLVNGMQIGPTLFHTAFAFEFSTPEADFTLAMNGEQPILEFRKKSRHTKRTQDFFDFINARPFLTRFERGKEEVNVKLEEIDQ